MTSEALLGNASEEATNVLDAERQLNDIFQKIGKDFGFEKVSAKYSAFKDFKVRWQRSYKWADFMVSDYMNNAPNGVVEDLAITLFSKICDRDSNKLYSDKMVEWMTSEQFVAEKQPIFIKRSRNISLIGEKRKLEDSYGRLEEMGLIEKEMSDVKMVWKNDLQTTKVGSCSILMRTIVISKRLDSEDIPEFVLDYVLYHELCHLMIGFDPTGDMHGERFQEYEDRFKRKDEAENWLRKFYLTL